MSETVLLYGCGKHTPISVIANCSEDVFLLTQHTGALRHTAVVRVEAVCAQVRRHHLLDQRLQL